MDWIKKNYDKFILAVFAVLLIAVAAMLFLSAQKFGDKFSEAMSSPPKSNKIPEVDTGKIAEAKKSFETPTLWKSQVHGGRLFTSELYYVKDGKLEKPDDGSLYTHSRTGDKIPNRFFMENGLQLLDPQVAFGDPDGDGFLNEDEWLNAGKGVTKPDGTKGESTDPNRKDSHPPYAALLVYSKYIPVPFRLKFQAWDGDPKKPEAMTFQINTLDLRQPSEFLEIGKTVRNTKFKIKAFEFKEVDNPSTGEKQDVSELVLVNTETEEEVRLVLNKVVDSPNRFGEFEYLWNKKHGEAPQKFPVQKLKEFVLQPDIAAKYKLLDVNPENAVIQTPSGEKITLPLKK